MKVLLVNGSPNEKGCTYTALSEIAKTLEEQEVYYLENQHSPLAYIFRTNDNRELPH